MRTSAQSLARQALAELGAPSQTGLRPSSRGRQGHKSGDGLASGVPVRELNWDDPTLQAFVRNDPPNAATKRPWLVAICQELDRVGYNALGVRRGACWRGLGFFAFAPLASGVIVVWSRRRLPPRNAREAGGTWPRYRVPTMVGTSAAGQRHLSGPAGPQSVLARNISRHRDGSKPTVVPVPALPGKAQSPQCHAGA